MSNYHITTQTYFAIGFRKSFTIKKKSLITQAALILYHTYYFIVCSNKLKAKVRSSNSKC